MINDHGVVPREPRDAGQDDNDADGPRDGENEFNLVAEYECDTSASRIWMLKPQ
jgi:hypothetical protein